MAGDVLTTTTAGAETARIEDTAELASQAPGDNGPGDGGRAAR